MLLNQKLLDHFSDKARKTRVDLLCLGLGYTAVVTSDGGIGMAYTYFEDKTSCMLLNEAIDYEGRPAIELLAKIKSEHALERSMALALVNALNYENVLRLSEDKDNSVLFNAFRLESDTNVAMVGYVGPLVKRLEKKKVPLEILDVSRGLGERKDFYHQLSNWADVLLLTSTSILNNTTEEILSQLHHQAKSAMLGPSTPMVAEVFAHLPVHMLAGTVPLERDNIIKAVRHGMGTPVLHRFSRKSYLSLSDT
ncbi:MAG: DUF364 domain-containing protein [Desulfobacterales bacterium]|nr:DUF364 domain-containing protein [Desulfobacterales bacterium]